MRKAYSYLFYKLYMSFELEQFHWAREWRVFGLINIIEGMAIFTLFNYLMVLIEQNLYDILGSDIMGLCINLVAIIVIALNYLYFHRKDKWKKHISEFYKWPKKKNRIGTFIVYSIILFVIINFIYSMNLYLDHF